MIVGSADDAIGYQQSAISILAVRGDESLSPARSVYDYHLSKPESASCVLKAEG